MRYAVGLVMLVLAATVGFAQNATTRPASRPAPAPTTSRPAPAALGPFEAPATVRPAIEIDRLALARLSALGIEPANLCSDGVFVRRVYLDAIGTLPTAAEAREFLDDKSPNKRAQLIDRLLERDEFADYWTMKWADLLRVKAEFPSNLWPNAVQAYYRWIHTSVKTNQPYDQFARALLTASGSNFRVPEVNFYRAVPSKDGAGIAQMVALTFMGQRAEKWPKERLAGMGAFFSQVGYKSTKEWKEEIVFWDAGKAAAAATQPAAVFPDGTPAKLSADRDPRGDFANWLLSPQNPAFARNIANRTWSWLLGRGIVQEADDIRPDNPPSNPELLAYLERELVAAKYDRKHLFRLILNSQTYQMSSIPKSHHAKAAALFASYPLRRLEAEVLIDAVDQITGTTEKYSSPIPEPFTFIPEDQRSITLADGSISSPFLELFGRSPRDTGLESERSTRVSSSQRLHFLNSSHIQKKLEQGPKMAELLRPSRPLRETVNEMYLTILSRYPTAAEWKTAESYVPSVGTRRREALQDLTWALVNSAEFEFRH